MSKGDEILGLPPEVRQQVWAQTIALIKQCYNEVGRGPIELQMLSPTPSPIVCFTDQRMQDDGILVRMAKKLVESGTVWISTVRISQIALYDCITNCRTDSENVEALASAVGSLCEEMLA